MAKRKRNKRDMSAGRIAMIAIVVGLLIGIALVAKNIITLSLEKRALLQQNSELTDKRDELAAELENVNDLDYIEEQARKLLHMIKPGEILYILNGGHPKDENGNLDIELPTQPNVTNQEETSEETSEEESTETEAVENSEEETTEESAEEQYEEEYYEEETSEESSEVYEESTGDEDNEGSDG